MKLSDNDKEVISCLTLQGDLDVPRIAKQTGLAQHAVRYSLSRLKHEEVIKILPLIDVFRLGYVPYSFLFSLRPGQIKHKNRLLKTIADDHRVAWLGELSGTYSYCAKIYVRTVAELHRFLDGLNRVAGDIFLEKIVDPELSYAVLRSAFHNTKTYGPKWLRCSVTDERVDIDDLDHRILRLMDADGAASHQALARKLGISLSTLRYRIEKLEVNRVISGYETITYSGKIGCHVFILLIRAKGFSADFSARLHEYAARHKNMKTISVFLGPWDFRIGVILDNPRDVIAIVEELQEAFDEHLQEVTTVSYFRAIKLSRYPFAPGF